MIKRKQTRLLVESILNGNTQKADRLLSKIIAEAEEDREDQATAQANAELGIQDQEEGQDVPPTDDLPDTDEDLGDGEESNDEGDDEFEALDDTPSDNVDDTLESDTELNNLVDKQVNFEVQVNNLVLNDLQNQCADLKTQLQNDTTLDKHSREYYEIKVPLQYYGDTLNKMQKDITPLVNQDEIKNQLDEISSSLQELKDKIGMGNDMPEPIATPNQVMEQEMGPQF